MSTPVGDYMAGYDRCSVASDETPKLHALLGTLDTNKLWEMLSVDFTVLEKRMGMENILIITDIFSRYSFAFPTKDQKATTVAKILKEQIFDRFGAPDK